MDDSNDEIRDTAGDDPSSRASRSVSEAVERYEKALTTSGGSPCDRYILMAIHDPRVQAALVSHLKQDEFFWAAYCSDAVGIPEQQRVIFEFRCMPPKFCFLPVMFLVSINMFTGRVVDIIDPYFPAPEAKAPQPGVGKTFAQAGGSDNVVGSHHPPLALHHPGTAAHHPSLASHHPNEAAHHPSLASHHPGTAAHHPSLASHHPGTAAHHPSLASHHPSVAAHHPSLALHHPSVAAHHPSLASHHPSVAAYHPSLASSHPSTAAHHPLLASYHSAFGG